MTTPPMPTSEAEWAAHWAFYQLTVAQRDAAWRTLEKLTEEVGSAAKSNRDIDWASWERHAISVHRLPIWPPFHRPDAEMRTYKRFVTPWMRTDNGEWSD